MAANRKRQLLGPDGEPVSTAILKQEISAPTMGGVRGTMWDQVASGLTPQRLAQILRAADEGDHRDYLTLAEEMEERELHYIAVLGTRKRAITGLPIVIEAASEGSKDQEIAHVVRELCEEPILRDLIDHMTDAIGKGYAVSEILWDTSANEWRPASFRDRDPRHFTFDRLTQREVRLIDASVPDGDAARAVQVRASRAASKIRHSDPQRTCQARRLGLHLQGLHAQGLDGILRSIRHAAQDWPLWAAGDRRRPPPPVNRCAQYRNGRGCNRA
ncbi:MAG: DUF935 family protein [Hyphomicrobium sp.]|nr:DUF935 family protein [Hyphomicrobium sp.]